MPSSSKSDSDVCLFDVELFHIEERCRELRKEKVLLKEMQSQSFDLIKRLDLHVRKLNETRLKDKKQIQDLQRELNNCHQEIDYLQDQLNEKNAYTDSLEEHVSTLNVKLSDINLLQQEIVSLREELEKSNAEDNFLAPKIVSFDEFLGRRIKGNNNLICNSYYSSFSSSSFDVSDKNGKIKVDSCLVVPPPKYSKPRAIIKFLGGAFIGKVSHVTYSYLVEFLAKEGYLVVLVPYNVTFNHEDATKQVYERFDACLNMLLTSGLLEVGIQVSQLVDLPVFSIGHRPATEAVPYFEQLSPLVSQVMPMMETTPLFSMANSLSDAWKALVDGAGAVMSQNDRELFSSVTQFVDQLPSVLDEVRQGTSEFRPTPLENRERCKGSYNVPHTLLVKFSFDAIDETDILEETLRPRVRSIGGTLEKIQLSGNHLTPCIQEPKWEVGSMYTPIDAVAQGLKAVSMNDTKVLAQTICSWLRLHEK